MCTVTLIPIGDNDFILTSNRDEAVGRKTLPPEFYQVNGVRMLFPKDAVAGGTWIGVSDKNTMVCLLNGGFVAHERFSSYRMSRGVVVKDLLETTDLEKTIEDFNFDGIEPFTIIAANWKFDLVFYELVWDGIKKHFRSLEKSPRIWSSSTLYSEKAKSLREKWFSDFIKRDARSAKMLLDFHKNQGNGDSSINLRMDRGFLKTVSVTQILKSDEELSMRYDDFLSEQVNTTIFEPILTKNSFNKF